MSSVAEEMVTKLKTPLNITKVNESWTEQQQDKLLDSLQIELDIEYPSEDMANIVKTSLGVDAELQPDKVKREMHVKGKLLNIKFVAVEARYLRASFSAFMDVLVLATRTIEQFGLSCQLSGS
eukprot:c14676_g1_i1 orf=293-661(-)